MTTIPNGQTASATAVRPAELRKGDCVVVEGHSDPVVLRSDPIVRGWGYELSFRCTCGNEQLVWVDYADTVERLNWHAVGYRFPWERAL